MSKYLSVSLKEYIFIILITITFTLLIVSKSSSEENVFVIDNLEVEGPLDLNFSRNKYINKAFVDSFEILTSRILLSRDLKKIKNIKLDKIKNLVESFQILEETYKNEEYKAIFKVFYSDIKVKKLLGNKNISFSEPKNISAIFFPVLFIDNQMQGFDENFFYRQWKDIKIKNELIDFILPLEDLDDILLIKEMKNKIEELNPDDFVSKYNVKNYVFALMDQQKDKMNIYLETNFNNNKVSKNIYYNIPDIKDKSIMIPIVKDLKMKITDLWKEENIVNLSMPLSIRIKFQHKNLGNIDELKKNLYKISIIDNYLLDEFSVQNSFIKIYYYGNPKKLRNELLKFGYNLKNDQGHWELYIDE